jgi:hypothetical protein
MDLCIIDIFKEFLILFSLVASIKTKTKKKDENYFSCFVAIVKKENRYIRETVEHYIKIGVEKFYFADDNDLNDEKISDVLQDYIDKGIVEVIDARGKNLSHVGFYQQSLVNLNNTCKWILYFDYR